MLRFRNFPVAKKFMDQRGGGEYQAFPWKIFCLRVPKVFEGGGGGSIKTFRRKVFVSLPKVSIGGSFSVSLVWTIEKVYGSEGRRRVSSFSVEKFLSHSAESFRRRGGIIKIFRRKNFVSLPKVSIGGSFSVSLVSTIEKVYGSEGRGRVPSFHVTIFCLLVLKIFVGETFCAAFQENSGSKKL